MSTSGNSLSQADNRALSALSLYIHEKVIETVPLRCELIREVQSTALAFIKTTNQLTSEFDGYLFLTSDRLIFAARRGTFDNSYRIIFALPYEAIASMKNSGGTCLMVATQAGSEFRLKPKKAKMNADLKLGSAIRELSINKMARLEKEKKRERIQVVLDFSFLRQLAEKVVITQAIKCPHCGGKIDLPTSGNLFDCSYCGNRVYAVDIYKEVNRLLGYTIDQIPSQLDLNKEGKM